MKKIFIIAITLIGIYFLLLHQGETHKKTLPAFQKVSSTKLINGRTLCDFLVDSSFMIQLRTMAAVDSVFMKMAELEYCQDAGFYTSALARQSDLISRKDLEAPGAKFGRLGGIRDGKIYYGAFWEAHPK